MSLWPTIETGLKLVQSQLIVRQFCVTKSKIPQNLTYSFCSTQNIEKNGVFHFLFVFFLYDDFGFSFSMAIEYMCHCSVVCVCLFVSNISRLAQMTLTLPPLVSPSTI